ncbi:extracellular solute-binding protein [Leptodesmis sp.]|uniref:extracellular solute-binding protein n=1 Tax=Leptodesmis sp. TaxID=3100501 RepID=UPI0040534DEB
MVEREQFGQINRRSLLVGMVSWAIGQGLLGCSQQKSIPLTIEMLRGSIPSQLLQRFRHQMGKSTPSVALNVVSEAQLQILFSQLQSWQQSGQQPQPASFGFWFEQVPFLGKGKTGIPDLVTLGDFWLSNAVKQGLLQPFSESDRAGLRSWSQLVNNPKLSEVLLRNDQGQVDAKGQVWGIPYRLSSTVIAYRRDILQQRGLPPPTDWQDLWRPEFRGRISLLNQPREVIGLALKKLGHSYNTEDLAVVPDLKSTLQALNQQAKFYSSDAYLQPLMLDDTWIAVGWSLDVLPLGDRLSKIAAVIPPSGTALSADLWVRPQTAVAKLSAPALAWLDFWWQPEIAAQLSLRTWSISPALLGKPLDQLPEDLRGNPLIFPEGKVLQASEFLKPLPEKSLQQYQQFWTEMRSPVAAT